MTVKEQLRQVIEELPDDATLDDAIERLIIVSRIDRATEELDAGQGIPDEEVWKRMDAKWRE